MRLKVYVDIARIVPRLGRQTVDKEWLGCAELENQQGVDMFEEGKKYIPGLKLNVKICFSEVKLSLLAIREFVPGKISIICDRYDIP